MTFISYAQNFEDVMLYRALKHIEKGFYIDVGAWDPVEDSVTKAFYDRGWRGINIEPVRTYYDKLVSDRPEDLNLMVAVGNRNGMVPFFEVEATGLSTMDKDLAARCTEDGWKVIKHLVPSSTLTEIFDANPVQDIHFLKIDVEGAEKAVLEGIDFSKLRPWIVVIEATEPSTQECSFSEWDPLLLQNEYEFVYFDGVNRFYVASEQASLREFFGHPPTVFDGFVKYREAGALQQAKQSEDEKVQLESQYLDAEKRLQEALQQVRRTEDGRARLEAQHSDAEARLHGALDELSVRNRWRLAETQVTRQEGRELRGEAEHLKGLLEQRDQIIVKHEHNTELQAEELTTLRASFSEVQARSFRMEEEAKAVRQEKDNLREEFIALQTSFSEVQARSFRMEEEAKAVKQERDDLREELTVLQASFSEVQARSFRMEEEAKAVRQEKDALQQQVEELKRWLHAVYTTISWRITAPLRLVKAAVMSVCASSFSFTRRVLRLPRAMMRRAVISSLRWAARDPRIRALGKRLLRAHPGLLARATRLASGAAEGFTVHPPGEVSATTTNQCEQMASNPIVWITSWNSKCGIASYSRHLAQSFDPSLMVVLANRTNDLVCPDEAFVERIWDANIETPQDVLLRRLEELRPQAVIVQYNFSFFSLKTLAHIISTCRRVGATSLVFFHGTMLLLRTLRVLREDQQALRSIQASLHDAAGIMVHSENDVDNLKSVGLSDNVTLFPHGVPSCIREKRAHPMTEAFRDKQVIASYGFILPHKGLRELVRAVATLSEKRGEVHLLLVNALYPSLESEEEKRQLDFLIRELRMGAHTTCVHAYLSHEESLHLLSSADIIAFPYQGTEESTSAAVRMGIAAGRPVAVTPLHIFDDLGDVVHRFSSSSVEAIADGLDELFHDPERLRALQFAGKAWASERSWPILSRRLYGMLNTLEQTRESDRVSISSTRSEETGKIARNASVAPSLARGPLHLARRVMRGAVRWTSRNPRARTLTTRVLARHPQLRAYIRRLLIDTSQQKNARASTVRPAHHAADVRALSVSVREVLQELRAALEGQQPPPGKGS